MTESNVFLRLAKKKQLQKNKPKEKPRLTNMRRVKFKSEEPSR
jgi:hypothetical protein